MYRLGCFIQRLCAVCVILFGVVLLAFLTQEESTMKLRLKLPLEGEERERTFLLGPG